MLLLAMDTSTDIASIALAKEDHIVSELTWHAGQNHTVELVPNIQHLLKQSRSSLDSLGAIIIARGPGSYNGLRVGMSVAKGLACGLRLPLVGIGTLEVEAYQQSAFGLPICPVLDAARGEVATALFSAEKGQWKQIAEEHITTLEALCETVHSATVFCGQIQKYGLSIKDKLGNLAIFPLPPAQLRRSGYLAALGWQRLKEGRRDDSATLQPLYLRQPPITQPKVKYNLPEEKTLVS